jgi:hypothetical protein
MRLALVGVVIGVGVSLYLARLISALLFGVTTGDPLVFVRVPVLLTIVSLDPMVALRYE